MPPIMGAGVFILATLTQTEYLSIALMNVIPAVLFFTFVLPMVDLEAQRTGISDRPADEIPRVGDVLRRGWFFFIPLVVVIGLLFLGYSPDFGAFRGTPATLALSWIRRETRMGPRQIFVGLATGAHGNASAGAAVGSLGVIIGGIILSDLGLKFSAVLVEFAAGCLLLPTAWWIDVSGPVLLALAAAPSVPRIRRARSAPGG